MPKEKQSVFYEFIRVGHALKVTAIDERTGIEASIVGNPYASQTELQNLAKQKLGYVMARKP